MFEPTIPREFRVSQYFTVTLAVCCVVVAVRDLSLGLAYAAAAMSILVPLRFMRVRQEVYYTILLAAGTIWLTHLVRPLVLMGQPSSFLYPRVISFDGPLAVRTLLTVAGMALSMLLGMVLGYRYFLRGGGTDRRAHDGGPSPLVRMRAPINVVLTLVVLLKAIGVLVYGVGFKGNPVPVLTAVSLFVPDLLVQGILILYLLRYRSLLGVGQQWYAGFLLFATGSISLLQGSKAFVLQLLLALFIYLLAFRGDFSIRVRRALLFGFAGVVVFGASFPVAMGLRRHVQQYGYDAGAFGAAVRGLTGSIQSEEIGLVANRATSRLLGFDGLMATQAQLPPEFVEVFALPATAARVRGRFVPWEAGAGSLTSGRAVSTFLFGHPEDLRHSGGVGVFAAVQLMAGPAGALFLILLYGIAWAAYFSVSERARDTDTQFLLRYAGAYVLIMLTMSGNADFLLPPFIIVVVETLALQPLLNMGYVALR